MAPTSVATCAPYHSSTDNTFSACEYVAIIKDGNYVYLPTSSGMTTQATWTPNINHNGYKKININSQADQSVIAFDTELLKYTAPIKCGDLLITNNMVCNGADGYSCAQSYSEGSQYYSNYYAQRTNAISSPLFPIYNNKTSTTMNRYIFANKMVNTTKYNLSSAIQKTASQAMTVEYTLQEIEEEEEE